MTRFLYLADTHAGADPMGYQQQPGYPEKLPQILAAVREYIGLNRGIDFIIHGGDMVDSTTAANLASVSAMFDLPVPVYLCLGNHDMTTRDAVDKWLDLVPSFLMTGKPDYSIVTSDCVIHVAPNQWCDIPYCWETTQTARFSPAQLERLSDGLNQNPEVPHILLTHSPVYGLPEEQTGRSETYHSPDSSFTRQIKAISKRHANLKCVLGAHNHMNMRVKHDGVEFVTVSSLVETPFEFKFFEVNRQQILMMTVSLQPVLSFAGEYNPARSFVQGRTADRLFSTTF